MDSTSDLKAMNWPFKNPKYIFFTDFDGTITLKDSNDMMVCKPRHALPTSVVDRQARQTTWDSARRSGNKEIEILWTAK